MKLRLPNPGDSKRKFFTRDTVKELIGTNSSPGMNTPGGNLVQDSDIVYGLVSPLATTDTVEPFRPVILGYGPVMTADGNNEHLASSTVYCSTHNDTTADLGKFPGCVWGVAQEFITKTQAGRIRIAGQTWFNTNSLANFTVLNGTSFDVFNQKVWQIFGGRGQMLNQLSNGWAIISLQNRNMTWFGRSRAGGVSLTTGGTVDLYEPTVTNSFSLTTVSVGCVTWPSAIVGQKFVEVSLKAGVFTAQEVC